MTDMPKPQPELQLLCSPEVLRTFEVRWGRGVGGVLQDVLLVATAETTHRQLGASSQSSL